MQLNLPLPKGYELEGHRILSTISSGGQSFVYLASDAERSLVALKEYMPAGIAWRALSTVRESDLAIFRAGLRCFFEEARALAGVRHPNVVRVLNFFRANGTAYMTMPYESGRTLQQHVEDLQGHDDEDWLRLLFVRLLNGLREVHAARLLHLDIKPANIWIRDDESPVLIDFGAARRALSEEGERLAPVYTPGFAAPEMHQSHDRLGPWSDIYSVGATLYACLARSPAPSAIERVDKDTIVPASQRWVGRYSADLLQTIDACLSLDATKRPRSVLELQRALAGSVSRARPVERDSRLAIA